MRAFQIDLRDNVATALEELPKGAEAEIVGECEEEKILAAEHIPEGHKLAVRSIEAGEDVLKYGVVIGRTLCRIEKGAWVHMHVMRSLYDERSGHLDSVTGVPRDTRYE